MFIEVVKSHSSLDNIGILTNFTNFHTRFICFVVNLTNDFFQKILEGNKTSNATVLIKQDSHLIIGVTKGCQEIIYEDSLRNKERFVHDSTKFDIFETKFETCFKKIFGMNDTDNLILVIFVNRNTRETFLENSLDIFLSVVFNINHEGIRTRDHNLTRHQFIKREYPLEHFNFFSLKRILTLGQHVLNLITCHLLIGIIKGHRCQTRQKIG